MMERAIFGKDIHMYTRGSYSAGGGHAAQRIEREM
jgi:hypothetical protein